MVYTIRGVWYIPYGNYATVLAPVCHWHIPVCNRHTRVCHRHNSGMLSV
ncbi:MAG: hypothetical protein LBV64_03630 [Mediterranea sp.]|nr:hypothetical protein [Mediterranea sp.]